MSDPGPALMLDAEAVREGDPTGQAADIADLANHLRDALWRVESAQISEFDTDGGLIVAGMGGSAIGGGLALAAFGPQATRPLVTARGYALPSWAGSDSVVLCSSYSGSTEETLAAYDAAKSLGARRVVATTGGPLAERARADKVPVIPLPGGFQPRAAVGYAFAIAAEVAALAGVGPSLHAEIEAAATLVEGLAAEWGPSGPEDGAAKMLARELHGHVPVVAGAELTWPVAYRWKTQFNENSKLHAFASELPELDHNEIVGWRDSGTFGRFAAVLLDDPATHPRTRRRVGLTAELIAGGAGRVITLAGEGQTRTERVASLVLLGDLTSLYLAIQRGVDPAEIDVLTSLKRQLADAS